MNMFTKIRTLIKDATQLLVLNHWHLHAFAQYNFSTPCARQLKACVGFSMCQLWGGQDMTENSGECQLCLYVIYKIF